jgi:hypothetical protein
VKGDPVRKRLRKRHRRKIARWTAVAFVGAGTWLVLYPGAFLIHNRVADVLSAAGVFCFVVALIVTVEGWGRR